MRSARTRTLGVVLVKLGRYDEAIGEYREAYRLSPDDARIGINLALALMKSGRLSEAAAPLKSLHRQTPDEKQIALLLADCQLQLGNDERVVELLRPLSDRTLQIFPLRTCWAWHSCGTADRRGTGIARSHPEKWRHRGS